MAEKRKRRRAYLEDYRKNERGRYEYAGRRYVCQGVDLGRGRARIGALCAGLAAAMAAVGCVDAPGMRGCFYVLLPYLAGLAGVGGTCLAAYRFCAGGDPMKEYAYEMGLRKLPGRAVFAAVCSGLAVVGEIAYALRHGSGGKPAGLAVILILETAAAALALLLRKDAEKLNSCCAMQSDASAEKQLNECCSVQSDASAKEPNDYCSAQSDASAEKQLNSCCTVQSDASAKEPNSGCPVQNDTSAEKPAGK